MFMFACQVLSVVAQQVQTIWAAVRAAQWKMGTTFHFDGTDSLQQHLPC
jgi:hypothetical protein